MTEYIVHVECDVKIQAPDDQHAQTMGVHADPSWRRSLYDLDSVEEVAEHLAFNCVANGVEDAIRLDGWAQLDPGTLTMEVDRSSFYYFVETST